MLRVRQRFRIARLILTDGFNGLSEECDGRMVVFLLNIFVGENGGGVLDHAFQIGTGEPVRCIYEGIDIFDLQFGRKL